MTFRGECENRERAAFQPTYRETDSVEMEVERENETLGVESMEVRGRGGKFKMAVSTGAVLQGGIIS